MDWTLSCTASYNQAHLCSNGSEKNSCNIGIYEHIFLIITKTYLYNFDPLKSHFYIVKLGFTGVYIIFLISAQNIDYGYSLEPPRRGGSNEYPQSMFWAEIWKISEFFIWKFSFLVVKISVYFNRHVFVMKRFALLVKMSADDILKYFVFFLRKQVLTFYANYLHWR